MDVKGAVKAAKDYVAEVFSDEGIANLGLEEVERDQATSEWRITVGFSRPWNNVRNALTMLTGEDAATRNYKVVRMRDDGEVVSVKSWKEARPD